MASLKIKLDMDGVMFDFVKGSFELMRIRNVSSDDDRLGWDYYKAFGHTDTSFWSLVNNAGPEFWRDLELLPWAIELYEMCKTYGDVEFLTSPSGHPNSAHGKISCLEKHFGAGFRDYCIKPRNKEDLALSKSCVLIDDYEVNTDKWRAAGGWAVLFPAPWNSNKGRRNERLAFIKQCLDAAAYAAETYYAPSIVAKTIDGVQYVPGLVSGRIEDGPLAFGTDWPGTFIRGDSSAYYAMCLGNLIEDAKQRGYNPIELAQLNGLLSDLCASRVKPVSAG